MLGVVDRFSRGEVFGPLYVDHYGTCFILVDVNERVRIDAGMTSQWCRHENCPFHTCQQQ